MENIPAKEITIEKLMIMRGKGMETPATQWESLGCAICDVVDHPTHIFPDLDDLKLLLSSKVDIVTPHSRKKEPTTKGKGKALCTNHACALCGNYGHYTHHCPQIP